MPAISGFGDFDLTNADELTESNSEVRRMQICIFLFYDIPVQPSRLGWLLVDSFGFNGPLRQYFSLYRTSSQREGERGEKGQM